MARFRPMLREYGLTEQQWRVIRVLAENDGIDASQLASSCYLLAPSLTRILQFLEREDLVRRTADRNDQRRSVLSLTARGRQVFNSVGPDSEQRYAEIEKEFGEERLDQLYELLADFYTTLNQRS
jgi:homoprotocatechuate degradation regulator HpaR